MRSNYKRLGDYIRQVDIRNLEDKKNNLFGVSTQKVFIESIANTIGTDFKSYKVIKEGQFAYVPDTSRRGDKIGIALLAGKYEGLISQAYTVFEVSETEKLIPEYLMMWFKRPEFDRYARYKSQGSVREIFDWNEMCDVQLPIPSIDKQESIVQEYNILANRITLNNQLNQKLEETAQAIYKHWFVDFEFPDENGKPYKSNGGEMVESEMGEIPKGWKVKSIKDWGKVITGKTPSCESPEHFGNEVSFVTPTDFKNYGKFVLDSERSLSIRGSEMLKNKLLNPNSLIITCIGSDMGKVVICREQCITNQQINSITFENDFYIDFLFYYLKSISNELKGFAIGGSTMPMINKTDFELINTLKPENNLLQDFHKILVPINNFIFSYQKQTKIFENLKDLLLSKLAMQV
jgi:type I restriction enzyme, S subunit